MLDYDKKQKILALVANGSSRRTAAKFIGCAPSTITRAVLNDQEFALQMEAAESNAEVEALRAIRKAARNERHWRAAAWILERKNPEDFGRRPPTLLTGEQVSRMFSLLAECLYKDMPEENYQRMRYTFNELLNACQQEQTTPTFTNKSVLDPPDENSWIPPPVTQHPTFDEPEFTDPTPDETDVPDDPYENIP